ncbi:MAG: hypothetical protein ACOCQG_05135 [Candidatus Nanoarchaeia archaeon]
MIKKPNINGELIFLLVVSFMYLVVFFIDSSYTLGALNNFLVSFLNIIPLLVFVFIVMFLVNYFLTPDMIKSYVGHSSGIRGWFYSLVGGVLIPAPPYIAFPLLAELKEKGMRDSLIVTFLYNRNLQLAFLPVMVLYFGMGFTIVFSIFIFVFAILSGLAIEFLMNNKFLKKFI